MRARKRRLLIRAGAVAVLLSVVVPNITYVGHWSSQGHTHPIQNQAEASEHAAHCHLGPSKCSSQPDFTGVSWIGGGPTFIATGATERLASPANAPSETDPPAARLLDPPRAA